MAETTRIHLTIPTIPLLDAQASQMILRREVGTAMYGIVEDIATQAKERTPVGVSGILRASIGTRVSLGTDASTLVLGEVYTGAQAPYAIFVEEDTRPHWPPWGSGSSLALWAQRVLGNAKLAFVVARKISRVGTKGRHFMRDALAQVRPTIEPRLRAAVERAALLLTGGR